MTNQKQDAIIAVLIEDKPDNKYGSPGIEMSPMKAWSLAWGETDWKPRPFISAPTDELDGIVLRWVQKNWLPHMKKFEQAHFDIWLKRHPYLSDFDLKKERAFMHYELGDNALALLEVLDADDI